jgi:spore coat protein U-like protein
MTRNLVRILLAVLALGMGWAHAAITCSVSSSGFATAYVPASPSANITQTFFTVTCTRGLASDAASVTWNAFANNGNNASGNSNRAAFGTNRIQYDVYRDAACSSQWTGLTSITGTITFTSTGTLSQQGSYWGCVPASQSVAAGTYTDNVTITLLYAGFTFTSTSAAVQIVTPASCSLTTTPGALVLNYVSFGATANGSTTFKVSCTNFLPYTLSLDATSGTVLGLNYTLGLSAASGTGTGSAQTYTITGVIAGGQSGNCAAGSCSASQARTLTIGY